MNRDKEVLLVGYSGHAFVAAEVILLAGYHLVGYLEKQKKHLNPYQLDYYGYEADESILKMLHNYRFFPAIGNNKIRREIFEAITNKSYEFISAIHPKSNISSKVKIGNGTLICQGANINPLVEIGSGVIINTGAIVEHECIIGNFAHIAPGAVLAGNVFVGENSFIGANAVLKEGVRIGHNVIIGAGTVVLQDIIENQTFIGNPAKLLTK